MYYFENFCFLCFDLDINTTSYDKNVEEKLQYLIPKYHILQVSRIPKHFCNSCLETLDSFHEFQRKCVKSIEISNNYVQKLSHENNTYACLPIKLTDILPNGESDTVSSAQANAGNIKQELEEEIFETNNYEHIENLEVQQENVEQVTIKIENTTNNFEIKREVTDELIITKNENFDTIDDIFECETCDLAFSTEIQLNDHTFWCRNRKRPVEAVNQIKNDCESNGRSGPRVATSTHIEGSLYSCDVCQKSFGQKTILNRHKRIHVDEKPFQCEYCKKTFSRKDHLKQHRSIHISEKPYKCDVCGKIFSLKSHLNQHELIHTGEKPYKCDVCEKAFSQKYVFVRHGYIHTGNKPHHCDVCTKTFCYKTHLDRHKRIHADEKPYKCDVCGKTFIRKDYLTKHKRSHTIQVTSVMSISEDSIAKEHTDENPYKCEVV